jgi:hypothetical protein
MESKKSLIHSVVLDEAAAIKRSIFADLIDRGHWPLGKVRVNGIINSSSAARSKVVQIARLLYQ